MRKKLQITRARSEDPRNYPESSKPLSPIKQAKQFIRKINNGEGELRVELDKLVAL